MRNVLCLLAATALTSCKVTVDEIDEWKATQRGPVKIRTALNDPRQADEVRVAALVAMAELGRLADLSRDLSTLPPEERRELLGGAVPRLIDHMHGANPKAPPSEPQISAKDALFVLRDLVEGPPRDRIDQTLVEWLAVDLGERMLLGEHNAEKIIKTIGAPAAPALIRMLTPGARNLAEPARMLREVGDEPSRIEGARRLLEIAQAQPPTERLFLAMALLGGADIAAHLNVLATSGEPQVRLWALLALQQVAHPSSVAVARAIASNRQEQPRLRDEAFGLLGAVAAADPKAAGSALVEFVADRDDKVRWTAVDVICTTADAALVVQAIERLPSSAEYKPDDLRDFMEERIRRNIGPRIAPELRRLLDSPSWVARLIAAHLLGDLGTAEDIPRLERLGRFDRTPIRGWPAGSTVGRESLAAAERIRKRG